MDLLSALQEKLEQLSARPLKPVTVAVVDSGVDSGHPELAGRVVKAVHAEKDGEDFRIVKARVPSNHDLYGHGTAIASVIAGIAPNAAITDIRVLNTQNVGAGGALVAGLAWAVEQKFRVINMSLACRAAFAPQLHALCEKAYRQNQVVVAARRNMPLAGDDGFPAEFSSCVSVDIGRFPTPFHLRFRANHAIEFIAHGEEVVVAAPGGGHTVRTGTSLATPAVTGLCALLVGAYPELRTFEVKSLLRAFAT